MTDPAFEPMYARLADIVRRLKAVEDEAATLRHEKQELQTALRVLERYASETKARTTTLTDSVLTLDGRFERAPLPASFPEVRTKPNPEKQQVTVVHTPGGRELVLWPLLAERWSPDRIAVVERHWPTARDSADILAEINRLPGSVVSRQHLQTFAATILKVKRPTVTVGDKAVPFTSVAAKPPFSMAVMQGRDPMREVHEQQALEANRSRITPSMGSPG
jgi:hypothetical protein